MAIDSTSTSGSSIPPRELLEQLPVLVYVFDVVTGKLDYVNPAIRNILGYRVDQVLGGPWLLLDSVHPDDQVAVAESHSSYDTSGNATVETECRVRHQAGKWCWLLRRDVVIERDRRGKATRVLGTAADITNRKLARRRLLNHQERFLQLIAYDLHDGVVQDIVGAQLALEGVADGIKASGGEFVSQVDLLRKLLRKAIDEGRRMIAELRPMIIDEMGVVESLEFLVAEEHASGRLQVEFTHDVDIDRLAPLLEGTVYRVAQESLNNVRRHAETKQARMRLTQDAGSLRLVVEDHGIGFEPRDVEEGTYGLEGIRERAKMFGGTASIKSEPGKGTTVSVLLPIELPPEWRDE